MILLLIKYKYVYCFYLLHEEPCNVDVANKPLPLSLILLLRLQWQIEKYSLQLLKSLGLILTSPLNITKTL